MACTHHLSGGGRPDGSTGTPAASLVESYADAAESARVLDTMICHEVTSMLAAYLLLSSGLFLIVGMALAVVVRPEGADSNS